MLRRTLSSLEHFPFRNHQPLSRRQKLAGLADFYSNRQEDERKLRCFFDHLFK